jgi:ketosteroid isomerase-like protein
MSVEDNKNLVRRFYRAIDAGNIDALDELVAEDYLDHSPAPFPGLDAPGRAGLPGHAPRRSPRHPGHWQRYVYDSHGDSPHC